MAKLNKEEKEILTDFEKGNLKSQASKSDMQRYRRYASTTFLKDKRVNIRISSKDLDGLQKKALEEGIPYQTLISSVLHKYVAGRLLIKKA